MVRPDNIPLPNLSRREKIFHTLVLLAGLAVFSLTWEYILFSIYSSDAATMTFGVELGNLAVMDRSRYMLLAVLHIAGTLLILCSSFFLFQKTSLRRRVKKLLFIGAVVLAALDFSGWLYAPNCSSTNMYVGVVGTLSGIVLALVALVPLCQLWVYRRWRNRSGKVQQVVIVGGGFAGLYAALGLNRLLGYHHELEITLLDRKNYFLFPPLLPSAAVGTIETRQVSYPFRRIFETTNILFRKITVTEIDPKRRVVKGNVEVNADPETGAEMVREATYSFDYLILAPGSVTQTFNTPGADRYAFFMRELNDAVVLRNHIIDCFERAAVLETSRDQRELLRFVVVGAGPTGIEIATEIQDLIHEVLLKRYPEIDPRLPEVVIVQSAEQVLPGWDAAVVEMTERQLKHLGVEVLLKTRVRAVGPRSVTLAGGENRETRTVVWCAGVRPNELLARSGLPLERSGRVAVNQDLSVPGFPGVFVLGDAAHFVDERNSKTLPPLGQVAFQQGSVMAKNLVRLLRGESTRPFHYFDFGGLVSVGEHFAAVNLMGVKLSGFIGWFVWRTLYLTKLIGTSNKIRVMIDWTLDLLIERSISQIRDHEPGVSPPMVSSAAVSSRSVHVLQ